MGTNRSIEERIADLDKKMEQLRAQKRAIQNRTKAEEKKARNHRLIQIGAEVEHYVGEIKDLDALKKYLEQYSGAIKQTQKGSVVLDETQGLNTNENM